jgi:hypothetical protein
MRWLMLFFAGLILSQGPVRPDSVTATVVPRGEYATIDTKPMLAVMEKLKSTTGHENDTLIQDIEKNSGNYAPPVFYSLATVLYNQGDKDDAIFWFNAGRLRADFDAMRCTDVSARDAVRVLTMGIPVELRKSQFDDIPKLTVIANKVIQWDATTPHNYEYRWINLHGLDAMQSGLGGPATGKPLSVPQETWDALSQQNRDQYRKSLDTAVAMIAKHKAATGGK